jgi:hypothetical protein
LITGTVFADDGVTPLENVNVDLEQGWFGECTDENGHYSIKGVAYGEHVIVAGRSWNWCLDQPSLYLEEYYDNVHDYDLATPISLNSTQDIVTGIDFTMDVGSIITGRVIEAASGLPLEDIEVRVEEYDNNDYDSRAWTDASGYYTITGLITDDYRIDANDYNGVPPVFARQYYSGTTSRDDAWRVTVGEDETVPDINFSLEPGGSISGQVVDQVTGIPIPNINVEAIQTEFSGGDGACTDNDGNFDFTGLPYGEHVIVAGRSWNWCLDQPSLYLEEYYDNVHNYDLATPITLGATQDIVTGIDFTMDVGSIITGRVIEAASGLPLEDIEVRAEEYDNNDYDSRAWTDASGYYTITGLIANDYRIDTNDYDGVPPVFARQYYSGTISWDDAWRVTVGEDETVPDINFSLEPGGSISGRVIYQVTGDPIPNINVSADRTDYSSGDGACTDNDGNFVISGIAYGDYYVDAGEAWNWCEDQPGTHVREFYDEVLFEFDATPVTVDGSTPELAGIDFALDTGGYIAGNVQDDSGQPISDLRIDGRIKTPDWNDHFGDTFTDENGDYLLGPLPEGEQFAIKTRADRIYL